MSTTTELVAAKERYDALVRRIEELADAAEKDFFAYMFDYPFHIEIRRLLDETA